MLFCFLLNCDDNAVWTVCYFSQIKSDVQIIIAKVTEDAELKSVIESRMKSVIKTVIAKIEENSKRILDLANQLVECREVRIGRKSIGGERLEKFIAGQWIQPNKGT